MKAIQATESYCCSECDAVFTRAIEGSDCPENCGGIIFACYDGAAAIEADVDFIQLTMFAAFTHYHVARKEAEAAGRWARDAAHLARIIFRERGEAA